MQIGEEPQDGTEAIGLVVRLCLRFGFLARVVTATGCFHVGLVGILGSW